MHGKDTKNLRVNQVKVEFTNKEITPFGSLSVITARFFQSIGLKEWVEENIPIEEKSPNGKGIYEKVIGFFLTVLMGGERFCGVGLLSIGKGALCAAFGVSWLPGSASVLTRFFGKIFTQKLSNRLLESGRELAKKVLAADGITGGDLRFDSSVFVRYGKQDGARKGYNPKKPGRSSHHPLFGFVDKGYVVNIWNRRGDSYSSGQIEAFFDETMETLKGLYNVVMVIADSGFYSLRFLEYMQERHYSYIIAVSIQPYMQREFLSLKDWRTLEDGIEVTEFRYVHYRNGKAVEHRYVGIRQDTRRRPDATGKYPSLFRDLEEVKEYRYALLVTNEKEMSPGEAWRRYRGRANDENVIKELEYGYKINKFCMKDFWATESVMAMLSLVLYNLMHYLKRNLIYENRSVRTLNRMRQDLFLIPAALGKKGREARLRLATKAREMRGRITFLLERICLISLKLKCNAIEGGRAGIPI